MVPSQVVQIGGHTRQIAAVSLNATFDGGDVGGAGFAVGGKGQEAVNQIMRNGRAQQP